MQGDGLSNSAEPVGSLEVALAHATRLLGKDPQLAAEQALEILTSFPAHPRARLILGAARRISGQTHAALEVLEPLGQQQPRLVAVQLELGIALGEAGRPAEACAAFRRALVLQADSPDAWRLLADQLDAQGDARGADDARAQYIKAATGDPRLAQAGSALVKNNLPLAEACLRTHLKAYPTDVAALRMLAEVAARLRRYQDAQQLLERCLELAPSFDAARHNYAVVLNRQGKADLALPQVEQLLAREPRNPGYRNLHAAVLAHLGDYGGAMRTYESVLKEFPRQPKVWLSYGHALKTAGQQADSVAAYRRAIALEATLGEAWWSLANLKTFQFSAGDLGELRAALARAALADEDRLHFEFALGAALEERGAYEESFAHYAQGNALRRLPQPGCRRRPGAENHRTAALSRSFGADSLARQAPSANYIEGNSAAYARPHVRPGIPIQCELYTS
jgi:predicted Zn-dependent protease